MKVGNAGGKQVGSISISNRGRDSERVLSSDELKKALKLEISRRVRDNSLEVPMLPHIASQALSLASNPHSTINKITELVEQDQFIAAKLINIANSPVYRGIYEVTSVQRAIMNIGLRGVTDLIFSLSIGAKVFRNKQFAERMNQMWQHSVGCAFIAQELARDHGEDTENAFLCGLLHDIGKVLIVDTISKMISSHPDRFIRSSIDQNLLEDVLSEFHCQVGGLIGRRWTFPESLTASVVFHHEPFQDGKVIPGALLTGVADIFCHKFGIGVPENPDEISEHPMLKALKISPAKCKVFEKDLHGQAILFISTFL
jgi:putative nucleotidyltransferase with HDIG domain